MSGNKPLTSQTTQRIIAALFPAALLFALLLVSACGNGAEPDLANASNLTPAATAPAATTPVVTAPATPSTRTTATRQFDANLGYVTVSPDAKIQIRLVQLAEDSAGLARGIENVAAILALADYGDIKGFEVEFGEPLVDPCEPDEAERLARFVAANPQVVGMLGTACSASAAEIAPVFAEAGLVLISSTSTSPDTRFGDSRNETTGLAFNEFSDRYFEVTGEMPESPSWAHAYDATTLLIEAVEAASHTTVSGELVIDRHIVRSWLSRVSDYQGLSGRLACDELGYCGAYRVVIARNEP